LCDDAELVVAQVCAELGVGWTKQLVDDDPQLRDRWGDRVPVTLVDGRAHDVYTVSEDRLRAALRR